VVEAATTGLPLVTRVQEEEGRIWPPQSFAYRWDLSIPTRPRSSKPKLIESKAALESGIRAMRGNLGYYVGIDRRNNAMSNVSLWESVEAAEQMTTFRPMLDLAKTFVELGVRFQRPILNFTTLWDLV
jgi:hypothetical protein